MAKRHKWDEKVNNEDGELSTCSACGVQRLAYKDPDNGYHYNKWLVHGKWYQADKTPACPPVDELVSTGE